LESAEQIAEEGYRPIPRHNALCVECERSDNSTNPVIAADTFFSINRRIVLNSIPAYLNSAEIQNTFLTTRTHLPSHSRIIIFALLTECIYLLISVFHRALLQSVIFISRLRHSVIQNLEVKIYVV